jgi:hypothetical protein
LDGVRWWDECHIGRAGTGFHAGVGETVQQQVLDPVRPPLIDMLSATLLPASNGRAARLMGPAPTSNCTPVAAIPSRKGLRATDGISRTLSSPITWPFSLASVCSSSAPAETVICSVTAPISTVKSCCTWSPTRSSRLFRTAFLKPAGAAVTR